MDATETTLVDEDFVVAPRKYECKFLKSAFFNSQCLVLLWLKRQLHARKRLILIVATPARELRNHRQVRANFVDFVYEFFINIIFELLFYLQIWTTRQMFSEYLIL